jgi:hypothetical protein
VRRCPVRSCLALTLLLGSIVVGGVAGCSSSTAPPVVASGGDPGISGSDSPPLPPCKTTVPDADTTVFFDATPDVAIGEGTLNPTTPPEGGTAFNGDATVNPTTPDAGMPCH